MASQAKPEFCRNAWNWHGMQTSVVAAGNGALSDGRYCSLAPDAKVVLVKVSRKGHICDDLIVEGIKWVRANAKRLNIRILNISVGSDRDPSALDCEISKEAEALRWLMSMYYKEDTNERDLLQARNMSIADQGIALALARMSRQELSEVLAKKDGGYSWAEIVLDYELDMTGEEVLGEAILLRSPKLPKTGVRN